MRNHPILFSAPMVKAILDGRKTQTRRIVKQKLSRLGDGNWYEFDHKGLNYRVNARHTTVAAWAHLLQFCPYGQPGDRLWVREAWQYYAWTEDGEPCIRFAADNGTTWPTVSDEWSERIVDVWETLSRAESFNIDNRARDRRWRPSIHMPRWASRITLEIVSVRIERLQDISEADATAEGIQSRTRDKTIYHYDFPEMPPTDAVSGWKSAKSAYQELWREINGSDSWAANPWVWVVEFKRLPDPSQTLI